MLGPGLGVGREGGEEANERDSILSAVSSVYQPNSETYDVASSVQEADEAMGQVDSRQLACSLPTSGLAQVLLLFQKSSPVPCAPLLRLTCV